MNDQTVHLPLPTDTVHVRLESRQYKLFVDLGEGFARWKGWVTLAIVVPYWAVLAVAGVSPLWGTGKGLMIYIVPAVVMVAAALRPDAGGRPRFALWMDRARFLIRRRRPIVDSDLARAVPGDPFVVSAEWVVLDPSRSRRLRAESAKSTGPRVGAR